MSQYFPKPFNLHFGDSIKVKIDLSNYATKTDIKNISHVDTSSFALKTNLSSLKTEVDKLDIDKLIPVPVDLSKLSDVVKNDIVKKTLYNRLVAKVDNIDSSDFLLKTKYNNDKTELENKVPDISNLATKTDYNTKVTEIENKLNNHNHDKYIDNSEFNKLATDVFNARIAQANLVTKTDFDAKLSSLTRKITKNKTDHLIVKNELNKLKTFDSGYFIGKSHFREDGTQNYLVFQPMYRYFKMITNIDDISSWKSKGLSDESFKQPTTYDNSLNPELNYYGTTRRVKFTGSCLKQSKISYTHGKVVNIYVVY